MSSWPMCRPRFGNDKASSTESLIISGMLVFSNKGKMASSNSFCSGKEVFFARSWMRSAPPSIKAWQVFTQWDFAT